MDLLDAILNLAFFLLIVYLILRVFNHFNNTKKKLNEMDRKIEELKGIISKKDL